MIKFTLSPIKVLGFFLLISILFSCTKDSDLLADYVLEDAIDPLEELNDNSESQEVVETTIDLENAAFTTNEDVAVLFNMLNNNTGKSRRNFKSFKQPKNGTLSVQKDSLALYSPSSDFNGADELEITLEVINEDDTTSDLVVVLDATVNPVMDVVNDMVATTENTPLIIEPLKNDTFKDGSNVILSEVDAPIHGTAVINEDNTLTYTPETNYIGQDTFTYTTEIINSDESITNEVGTITVTINSTTSQGGSDMGELLAFPGAEGFGKYATGGRGGAVIKVTNLNDSGSGSFRAACSASGARTIVFTVGGTITLNSVIKISNPNITIAGETAPGYGILLKNGSLAVSTSNVIIRHLRIRGSSNGDDALRIKTYGGLYSFGISDIIVDHCSFSWASDENISVVNAKNVTIQKCIIAESGYGVLAWSNKDLSVLNNIFAFNSSRNIETNQQLGTYLAYEEINNLVNTTRYAIGHGEGLMATVENNIFERSQHSNYPISFTPRNSDYASTSNDPSLTYLFESGNTGDGISDYTGPMYSSDNSSFIKNTPLYRSTYAPVSTNGLKASLLADAGALPKNRDAVDLRIISQINAGTGSLSSSGTFPTIEGGTAYADQDNDGMEDSWEITTFGSLSTDNNTDSDGDGYTNLETFLHYLNTK